MNVVLRPAIFQSTPPAWGATARLTLEQSALYISIHAPAWGATSAASRTVSAQDYFNPRSRMGSDVNIQAMVVELSISIHAPRMGSDCTSSPFIPRPLEFQSTLPAWGATNKMVLFTSPWLISIHAPRMGSDYTTLGECPEPNLISIHAPRMGSDLPMFPQEAIRYDFNPRSPHGERPVRRLDG